jgi:hypothetical protein
VWGPWAEEWIPSKKSYFPKDPNMIKYVASLDVPEPVVSTVARLLRAHRLAHDARPWQRAATPRVQAIMVLRWLRDGARIDQIARDAHASGATGYRYIHEAIEVIAAHAPDLDDVLSAARSAHLGFVCLDGTLIETAAVHEHRDQPGPDLWFSGKHHRFGANIQVLADPTGFPCGHPRPSPAPLMT